MAKNLYKHKELIKFKCNTCGKEFERYDSKSLHKYYNFCSLECEYKYDFRHIRYGRYSYNLKKLILDFSIEMEELSTRRIATIFGVSNNIVSTLIKKYGNRLPKKLINFNRDFFNKIDTEEKAYILGFIYADGCISRYKSYSLDITLQESDRKHLIKIGKTLNYEGQIKSRKITLNNKQFKACRICFCSEELCKDLIKLGATINKSLTLKFPSKDKIPTNLLRHFNRGYVDGDGHIRRKNKFKKDSISYSFELLGTYEFLKGFLNSNKNILNLENLKFIRKDKRKIGVNNFYINLTGKNARNLINKLYNNSNIHLDRKYEIYKEMKQNIRGGTDE